MYPFNSCNPLQLIAIKVLKYWIRCLIIHVRHFGASEGQELIN